MLVRGCRRAMGVAISERGKERERDSARTHVHKVDITERRKNGGPSRQGDYDFMFEIAVAWTRKLGRVEEMKRGGGR